VLTNGLAILVSATGGYRVKLDTAHVQNFWTDLAEFLLGFAQCWETGKIEQYISWDSVDIIKV